jgi:hypothetical protein
MVEVTSRCCFGGVSSRMREAGGGAGGLVGGGCGLRDVGVRGECGGTGWWG